VRTAGARRYPGAPSTARCAPPPQCTGALEFDVPPQVVRRVQCYDRCDGVWRVGTKNARACAAVPSVESTGPRCVAYAAGTNRCLGSDFLARQEPRRAQKACMFVRLRACALNNGLRQCALGTQLTHDMVDLTSWAGSATEPSRFTFLV